MNIKLKILCAALAAGLALTACGSAPADSGNVNKNTADNNAVENNQAESQPEEEKTDMEIAKEIMAGIKPEETCPEELSAMKTEVDYGEIVKTTYYSTTCERDRNVNIVLPAGYSEDKKYPVMYILHGIFGDENSMLGDGKSGARVIIGNMVNDGKAKEMILVFPNMYASKDPNQAPAFDPESVKPYDDFVDDLGKRPNAVYGGKLFGCHRQEEHRCFRLLDGRQGDIKHCVCTSRSYRIRLRDSSRTRIGPRQGLGDGARRNLHRG